MELSDHRPSLFAGARWYEELAEPARDVPSAWHCTKSEMNWAAQLLSVAADYAHERGLLDIYRARLAGISAVELTPERAKANSRSVSSPIWVILHELIVACYLERVLGWKFDKHEPAGYKSSRGDWQLTTQSGESIFVEVKTAEEAEFYGESGVFSRGVRYKQVRNILKGAYRQLPDDPRSTLVVVVGRDTLEIPFGIMLGDLFQTLFGAYQLRFRPFEEDAPGSAGPSFHDMLVHGTKHRRLGCVAGMNLSGLEIPRLGFYAIDNPYAEGGKRIREESFTDARRFFIDRSGHGEDRNGLSHCDAWERMSHRTIVAGAA